MGALWNDCGINASIRLGWMKLHIIMRAQPGQMVLRFSRICTLKVIFLYLYLSYLYFIFSATHWGLEDKVCYICSPRRYSVTAERSSVRRDVTNKGERQSQHVTSSLSAIAYHNTWRHLWAPDLGATVARLASVLAPHVFSASDSDMFALVS